MSSAQHKYEQCRDAFNEHVDDCTVCRLAVASGHDFCAAGTQLSVDLDSATVDAMADANKSLLGEALRVA